jgi:DNA-binding LacI/PurR family transcriptional regulator
VEILVTIRAVGERAGFSPSTVSRALNTPGLVRMETRRRVEEAAASLGYRPNRVARGLITGRIGMVGLVVPDIANPFYPTLVRAADHAAHASSLALLLADTNERPDVEEELLRDMGRFVDGIILCSSRMSSEQIAEIGASGGRRPFVSVNRPIAGASFGGARLGDRHAPGAPSPCRPGAHPHRVRGGSRTCVGERPAAARLGRCGSPRGPGRPDTDCGSSLRGRRGGR